MWPLLKQRREAPAASGLPQQAKALSAQALRQDGAEVKPVGERKALRGWAFLAGVAGPQFTQKEMEQAKLPPPPQDEGGLQVLLRRACWLISRSS